MNQKLKPFLSICCLLCIGILVWQQQPAAADEDITLPDGFQYEVLLDGSVLTEVSGIGTSMTGDVYISDIGEAAVYGDEQLLWLEPDLTSLTVMETGLPLGMPARLAVGHSHPLLGNNLVLADWNSNETAPCCYGRVFQVDRGTFGFSTLAVGNPAFPPPGDPFGVALEPSGAGIYIMDFEGASPHPPVLYRINNDGTQSVVASNPAVWTVNRRPTDIAFGPGNGFGDQLYVADSISPPTIWKVSMAGDITSFFSGAPLQEPAALAFGPGGDFGTDLYVFDDATGTIYTVTATGVVSTFATGLPANAPSSITPDMAFAQDGSSLLVGTGDRLISIFVPPPTWADLYAVIAAAQIDNEGVRRSLQAKAEAAYRAYDRGNLDTAGEILCALLDEVVAQTGVHIEPASAETIRNTAVNLATALGIPLPCLTG